MTLPPMTSAPIERTIATAREALRLRYPAARYPGLTWESARWVMTPLDAPAGSKSFAALWVALDDTSVALPPSYVDVWKAYLVLKGFAPSTAAMVPEGARHLWAALVDRHDPATFTWNNVTSEDFDAAEAIVWERRQTAESRYTVVGRLATFFRWAVRRDVLHETTWTPRQRDPKSSNQESVKERRERADKRLPSGDAIRALGQIYLGRAALDHFDRLCIYLVGLLLVGGFRSAELLTLPLDCEVHEEHKGRPRMGIRYWNRKTHRGRWQWAVRWLSPMGAELAREILAELREITEEARGRAHVLEASPNQVRLDMWYGPEMTTPEVAESLGWSLVGMRSARGRGDVPFDPIRSVGRKNFYARADVESLLLTRRGSLTTFDAGNGVLQSLSQTLAIVHPGAAGAKHKHVARSLVTTVTYKQLTRFLGDQKSGVRDGVQITVPSIFTRLGITTPAALGGQATTPSLRTHALRHWLNTMANKGGMSAFQISQWMQRADERQTLRYLHSSSDLADLSREETAEGRRYGVRPAIYGQLPEDQRERFLRSTHVAHQLTTGTCTANFATSVCPYEKRCEAGCHCYERTIGDPRERQALAEKLVVLERARARMAETISRGTSLHPRQVQRLDEHIMGVQRALSVDAPGQSPLLTGSVA